MTVSKSHLLSKVLFLYFSRNIVVFIVLLFYPRMIEQLGLSKVFWAHAAIMFIGNIFVFFVMPETRGLTMTQLNEIFGGKISYEKDSNYGDTGDDDEEKDRLNADKNFIDKTSSVANMAVHKVASTAALTKVASAAAISRVASYAKSVGGGAKGK